MFYHTLVNNFLENSAAKYPDKVALVYGGERLTYGEINKLANKLAAAMMETGIKRGDRAAIFMDNSIETVISIFAVLKAGAAFILINHTTKSEKLEYIMNNSRARIILTQGIRTKVVQKIICPHLKTIIIAGSHNSGLQCISYDEVMESGLNGTVESKCINIDLASIIYTSGSTGDPKGVMLSHFNMVSAAHSISTYLENNENDIIMNVLPLSFDYGLYQILMAFKIGGTIVMEKSFAYPYQVVETMIKENVTGFPGVPTIFAILLRMKNLSRYDLSSIRYITNTAAALPVSHIKGLRDLVPAARIYSMYGLTECKRVSYLSPEEIEIRPNSVGKGMPNQEVYIVDEKGTRVPPGEVGELVVRGANVMLGYWDLPEDTEKRLRPGRYPGEKVLYTGDLFKMDDDGYLYFVARKDDIIKSRGEKVSPKEIENVLYSIEGILEAAVIGVPDEIFGEAIKVFVAIEKSSGLTEKDILRYCSQHLENIMVPKYVELLESLPKTTTGKIEKASLKRMYKCGI
jgi:amino acid adenylation domain-containing protein